MSSPDGQKSDLEIRGQAQEMAFQAYTLRVEGRSWLEIAKKVGYDSPSNAAKSVGQMINAARSVVTDEQRQQVMDLELARLDAMQAGLWGSAISGDTRSVDSVLKIMIHRAKLLQLGETQDGTGTRTVIITSDQYVERLKELAE